MPNGGNPISLKYARQLVKNYKDNNLAKSSILPDDTQAVWFSRESLLDVLGIEDTAVSPAITGLRFYFGAYGTDNPDYPKSPSNREKLTLVVVETGTDNIEIERDGELETVYLDLISDTSTEPGYPEPGDPAAGKTIYNDGQQYPPPADRGLGL
ncbi:MAG: hypothetical protein ABIT58_02795 [Ferruginibacter sp.]